MRILLLKTWRDILARKGQFGALILLVALGIVSYVTFRTSYLDLNASVARANSELKFADFSVQVAGAPGGEVRAVGRVPGVRAVEGRFIGQTGIDVGTGLQPVARIIGVPVDHRPRVNDLLLESGRWPAAAGRDEAMVHFKYAYDTGTKVGDTIVLRMGQERRRLTVVGIVASPEYMYAVGEKGDMPTKGEFAPIFVPEHDAEELFGRPGAVTDISVIVEPGADPARVMARVADVLDPYGVERKVLRADQPSYFQLASEIEQNRVMAYFLPVLILLISSSSLFIALSRLVTSQRGQIGLAKALGYSDAQVLTHYLLFALFIGVLGTAIGIVIGDLGARETAAQYIYLLGVPYMEHHWYPEVIGGAVAISLFACVAAGLAPAWRSARMAPAMAMHSDPNVAISGGRKPLVEKLLGWAMPRSFSFRIPLRNVFRARRRAAYTVLGIAFAMVLTVATRASFDSIDNLITKVFTQGERWDVMAVYSVPFGGARLGDVARWDGVTSVQPALFLPVEITAGGAKHEGVLTALDPSQTFHGFDVTSGSAARDALARGDAVLGVGLANKLGVKAGDSISVKTPLRDDRVRVRVGAISDEPVGAPAYVSLQRARDIAGTAIVSYNALYVNVDARRAVAVKDDLFDLPGAVSVSVKGGMLKSLVDMMQFADFYEGLLFGFGFAIAFVVIYTTFTSNVLERTREIATMRTIGESNARLAWMVTVENLILAVVGIPLGIWLGKLAADALYTQFSSEAYTLKATLTTQSVIGLSLATLVVLLLSEVPPIMRIFRMDLAEATKVME